MDSWKNNNLLNRFKEYKEDRPLPNRFSTMYQYLGELNDEIYHYFIEDDTISWYNDIYPIGLGAEDGPKNDGSLFIGLDNFGDDEDLYRDQEERAFDYCSNNSTYRTGFDFEKGLRKEFEEYLDYFASEDTDIKATLTDTSFTVEFPVDYDSPDLRYNLRKLNEFYVAVIHYFYKASRETYEELVGEIEEEV